MKLFLLLVFLFCCFTAKAEKPYELPRSSVIELEDKSAERVYPVFIQLPPSHMANKNQTYPVIYLTDAHYSFPIVSGAMRFPMNTGVMQHAIIVALSYEKGSVGANSRIRDFTPTVAKSWKQETGNARAHMNFLRDTVMPFIEKNYRASKTNRTFVGHSLGGLFGAYMLLTEPNLFSNYILGSPSVWFDDNAILKISSTQPQTKIKVYLSVGEHETPAFGEGQDMVAGAVQLKDKIAADKNTDIEINFSIISGASHATAFPTTAIQGLHWVYGIKRQ